MEIMPMPTQYLYGVWPYARRLPIHAWSQCMLGAADTARSSSTMATNYLVQFVSNHLTTKQLAIRLTHGPRLNSWAPPAQRSQLTHLHESTVICSPDPRLRIVILP